MVCKMAISELLSWVVLGGSIGGIAATFIRVKVENDGMSLDEVRVRPKILLALASISLLN